MRVCPMATKIKVPYPPGSANTLVVGGDKFTSWGKLGMTPNEEWGPVGTYGSYGINGYLYVPGSDPLYGKPADYYWRTPNVKGGSNIPMFLDGWFFCGWPEHTNTPPSYDGDRWASDANAMNRFCINRHDGFINAAFVDYTVRRVGLKELWTLKWSRDFNKVNPWTTAGGVLPGDWPNWMSSFQDY